MNSINNIVKKLRENRILNEREDYSKYPRDKLISLAQDGDQLAVETLISTHEDFIKRMSSKYFLGSGDKEDVEQIATIAFWDAINTYDPKISGDFEAYAGRTIKRRMSDEIRKEATDKRQANNLATSLDEPVASDDEGGESTLGSTLSSQVSTEEEYLGKFGARDIMKFIENNLSDTEREVIKKYIQGYKIPEIVEEMDMKYKSVENAILRVKNKLAEHMRRSHSESKKLKEDNSLEFTEEEKQVLSSIFGKIEEKISISESVRSELAATYEKYTEEQFDYELEDIEDDVEEILSELEDTDYDSRDDLIDSLGDLRVKLLTMEEFLSDEQYEVSEKILSNIRNAENVEFRGDTPDVDPYRDRGLRQSDFV